LFEVFRGLKLRSEWGTSGVSFRMPTPDRSEPLSVAWIFQEAGPGWLGLRGLNLGFDAVTAKQTPSVSAALEQYVKAVASLTDAVPVKPSRLRAYQIPLSTVVDQQNRIAEILANLVQQGSGEQHEAVPASNAPLLSREINQ
jgi:hypothetical protein